MGLRWFGFEPAGGFAVGGEGLDIWAEGHEEGLVRVRVRVRVRIRVRIRVRVRVRVSRVRVRVRVSHLPLGRA